MFSERCSRISRVPAITNHTSNHPPSVVCLFRDILYKQYVVCVRTSTRLAHLLLVAQFRRLLLDHLLIRRRRGVLFVLLRTALQDVTGWFSVLFLPPVRYGSTQSFTYSRSLRHPCGHPIHARHHPFQRKRSLFYLCRQQSRHHAKTSCLLDVLRKNVTCRETSCRTSIFCETARMPTQHSMSRMLRSLKRKHHKAVSKI